MSESLEEVIGKFGVDQVIECLMNTVIDVKNDTDVKDSKRRANLDICIENLFQAKRMWSK